MASVVAFIRRLACARSQELPDADLVRSFHAEGDREAFATLVERHGPLVWSVCRRVVGNVQDAEDAFQATFLVFARKAGSIRRGEAVASWLYGVAYRTAVKIRLQHSQRRSRERQAAAMPRIVENDLELWEELQPLLDEELHRLPAKDRDAIVLCHLQGKSREDAARQLGCGVGTLKSRLSRGLDKLRARLARRGIEASAGVLGAVLAEQATATSVAVPAGLAGSTVKAALLFAGNTAVIGGASVQVVTLADGLLKAMLLSKVVKATAVVLLAASLVGSVGVVGSKIMGERSVSPETVADRQPIPEPPQAELDRLRREMDELRREVRSAQVPLSGAVEISQPSLPPDRTHDRFRDFKNERVEAIVLAIADLQDRLSEDKTRGTRSTDAVKMKEELTAAKQELERRKESMPTPVLRMVKEYEVKLAQAREADVRAQEEGLSRRVQRTRERSAINAAIRLERAKLRIWAAELREGTLKEAEVKQWLDQEWIVEHGAKFPPRGRQLRPLPRNKANTLSPPSHLMKPE